MNDIKLIAKSEKRIGVSDIESTNIQPGYRNRIWHRKLYQAHYEKWEKTQIMQ